MWTWVWVGQASAGCAVDPDAETKWATAPLVATGEVVSLAIVGPELVEAVVRLDPPRVGVVESGFLALRTHLSGGFCPGDELVAPGRRVGVAAAPDAEGIVWPSPCARDVVPAEALAGAGVRAPPGRWPGAPPPVAPLPAPYPTGDGRQARVARAGRASLGGVALAGDGSALDLDAEVVAIDGARATLLLTPDEAELAVTVEVADLARAPIAPVSPAPGVRLLPGARVVVDGGIVAYDQAGVRVAGPVDAGSLGVAWTPEPELPTEAGGAWLLRDAALLDRPGGRPVASLSAGGTFALLPTATRRQGHLEVEVRAPGLRARGFLPESVVTAAGLVGYGRGSGTGVGGRWIVVEPGVALASPDGAAAIGRTTGRAAWRELAVNGSRAWVAVTTPWGPVAARVECAAPPDTETPCAPP